MEGSRNILKEVYGECQKNHSAKLGTTTKDGCGEYMADDTTQRGLYCDACGCHRNFHKKIVVLMDNEDGDELLEHEHETTASVGLGRVAYEPQQKQHAATSGGTTRANLSNALGVKDEQRHGEHQEIYATATANVTGWRMPTRSSPIEHEESIRKVCNELGITRFVFKTWMNNQKKYHVQYSATSTPIIAPPPSPSGFS